MKTTRGAMSSQRGRHELRDPLAGRPIPVRIQPVPFHVELSTDGIAHPLRIRPLEEVRSDLQRLRSFRVHVQSNTGTAEEKALLLETAGIRHQLSRYLLDYLHCWFD